MTPHEIELAIALGGCSMLPASAAKRFCRSLAFIAANSPEREITLRQRHYLEILAWRFRRQLPRHLVPQAKPFDLPRAVKQKGGRQRAAKPTALPAAIQPPDAPAQKRLL